jgi:hypothetical protein
MIASAAGVSKRRRWRLLECGKYATTRDSFGKVRAVPRLAARLASAPGPGARSLQLDLAGNRVARPKAADRWRRRAMMTWEQGTILAVLGGTLAMFVWDRWRYDVVALTSLMACVVLGLIGPDAAFAGFSNPAVITVAAVLVISRALARAPGRSTRSRAS